jgi:hypothetical protein
MIGALRVRGDWSDHKFEGRLTSTLNGLRPVSGPQYENKQNVGAHQAA